MKVARFLADACYVTLITGEWLATTLLGCLGLLPVVVFVGFAGDGQAIAWELADLAQHYLDAAPNLRAQFNNDVAMLAGAAFGLALLIRAPFFVLRLWADLQTGDVQ